MIAKYGQGSRKVARNLGWPFRARRSREDRCCAGILWGAMEWKWPDGAEERLMEDSIWPFWHNESLCLWLLWLILHCNQFLPLFHWASAQLCTTSEIFLLLTPHTHPQEKDHRASNQTESSLPTTSQYPTLRYFRTPQPSNWRDLWQFEAYFLAFLCSSTMLLFGLTYLWTLISIGPTSLKLFIFIVSP